MSVEQYEVRLAGQCIVMVDLADAADRSERLTAIVELLRKHGASPVGKHTFALSAEQSVTLMNLQDYMHAFLRVGDLVISILDSDRGMICKTLVFLDSKEGISVESRKSLSPS